MIVRLDLADLLVEQDLVVALAVEDLLARLADADRAQRVGLARPAERRLHLLPGLLQRQIRPLRRERHSPGFRLFTESNTAQAPLATRVRPFSTYLIGLCMMTSNNGIW